MFIDLLLAYTNINGTENRVHKYIYYIILYIIIYYLL